MRTPIPSTASIAFGLLLLAGCGGSAPPNAPSTGASEPSTPAAAAADGDKTPSERQGKPQPEPEKKGAGGAVGVGDKAPTFSVDSMNGQGKVSVNPGKVTIVDFWATWCKPCEKSFPKYQELYVKYKASGLEIAAVSVDEEKGGIPAFAKSHGAKFPIGWDDGKKIADKYKPENMPTAYVIDKQGVVRHVHKGYHDGEEKELEKEIKGLL
jgi:peroxiredoxin